MNTPTQIKPKKRDEKESRMPANKIASEKIVKNEKKTQKIIHALSG